MRPNFFICDDGHDTRSDMTLFRCTCRPDHHPKIGDVVVVKGPPGRPQIGYAPGTTSYPLHDPTGCPRHDPLQQAVVAKQRAALITTTRRAGV
jgi:hypothetical protein